MLRRDKKQFQSDLSDLVQWHVTSENILLKTTMQTVLYQVRLSDEGEVNNYAGFDLYDFCLDWLLKESDKINGYDTLTARAIFHLLKEFEKSDLSVKDFVHQSIAKCSDCLKEKEWETVQLSKKLSERFPFKVAYQRSNW